MPFSLFSWTDWNLKEKEKNTWFDYFYLQEKGKHSEFMATITVFILQETFIQKCKYFYTQIAINKRGSTYIERIDWQDIRKFFFMKKRKKITYIYVKLLEKLTESKEFNDWISKILGIDLPWAIMVQNGICIDRKTNATHDSQSDLDSL